MREIRRRIVCEDEDRDEEEDKDDYCGSISLKFISIIYWGTLINL